MDIRNCSRCGKIYIYDGFKLCVDCRKEDEEDFYKVKHYLEENPNSNIIKVSEDTQVDSKKIIEFLKEGRLEIRSENNLILNCERCGKPITKGRFCNKCTSDMEREFKKVSGGTGSVNQSKGLTEKIKVAYRHKKNQ